MQSPNLNLKSAISLASSGKKVPAMSLIRNDPEMAALISKLVTPREPAQYDGDGKRRVSNPDTFSFRSMSDNVSQNVHDAETIMQILPDMELWAQILISSILSPKDMTTTEVNYVPPADLLPSEVSNALILQIKTHFEQVYKIKPLLPDILRDVLFTTGSYPVAVLPENSLDEVINGTPKITMESLKDQFGDDGEIKPIGLLGPKVKKASDVAKSVTGISFESFKITAADKPKFEDSNIAVEGMTNTLYVTDNPDLLRVPQINERIRDQLIITALGTKSMESLIKLNDREVAGLVYKNKQATYKQLVSLKTDNQLYRRSVGEPLIIRIASEAVIPVHIPGAPEKQIGFFVLIDADGNPISKDSADDQYRMLGSRMSGGTQANFPSAMIDKVQNMMGGQDNKFDPNNRMHLDYSVRAYSEVIEADLMARLRNGVYGNGVAIANNQEVYRIMLARTLQKQNTQLLFLPVELMTYFALKYDTNGIGRSLIDDMKVLLSLRIMLMFANVMASIKNSIGRTEVKLKLDEHDPDPKKTIEIAQHEIIRSRMQSFPIGMSTPSDMVDWLQRAGFEFTFEGHPGLPDVAIDFGEKNTSYTKPDTELEEQLRKNSIMAAGLNPETVDAGFNAEFATSVVANNLLLSKRVIQIQERITPHLTDHVRKVISASQPLSDTIRLVLKENLVKIKERLTEEFGRQPDDVIIERVYQDFIHGMEVTLPSPNSVTLENQNEALKVYMEALDGGALDAYVSDKFFTDATGGNISGEVAVMREAVRAYFIRKWINENGMLPELTALTTTGEDGAPMINFYDEQLSHIEALGKSLTNFMVKIDKSKQQNNAILDNQNIEAEGSSGSVSEPVTSGNDEFGGSGGGFDEMPDFGGPDETPIPEETPVTPEEEVKQPEEETPPPAE